MGVTTDGNACARFHLKTIPRGILNFFNNFWSLELRSCSITHLNGNELEEYPQISNFKLCASDLKHIPGNLFALTTDMKLIALESNEIESVGKGLLDGLRKLEVAYFEHNRCIDTSTEHKSLAEIKDILNKECVEKETSTTEGPSPAITTEEPNRCCKTCANDAKSSWFNLLDDMSSKGRIKSLENEVKNLNKEILKHEEEFKSYVKQTGEWITQI